MHKEQPQTVPVLDINTSVVLDWPEEVFYLHLCLVRPEGPLLPSQRSCSVAQLSVLALPSPMRQPGQEEIARMFPRLLLGQAWPTSLWLWPVPCWRLHALGTATFAGFFHLLNKGRAIAALKGVFPALQTQSCTAAWAWA